VSDKPENAPKQDEDFKLPQELTERLIRGEIELGQYLRLPKQKQYEIATIGYQMLQAGRTELAREIFEGLVAASPLDGVFRTQLGATYMTLERVDDAFGAFDQALQVDASNVDALVGRGEIYLRRGQVPEGLKDLSRAIELDPGLQRRSTQRARGTLLALKQQVDQVKAPPAGAKK
jgi:tetratricopeptide (TPR) repeat protein